VIGCDGMRGVCYFTLGGLNRVWAKKNMPSLYHNRASVPVANSSLLTKATLQGEEKKDLVLPKISPAQLL